MSVCRRGGSSGRSSTSSRRSKQEINDGGAIIGQRPLRNLLSFDDDGSSGGRLTGSAGERTNPPTDRSTDRQTDRVWIRRAINGQLEKN